MALAEFGAAAVAAVVASFVSGAIRSALARRRERTIIVREPSGKEHRLRLPREMSPSEVDAVVRSALGKEPARPSSAGAVPQG